jgi:hypothetical protein
MNKLERKECEACSITSSIDSELMHDVIINLEDEHKMTVCYLCYGLLKYLVEEKKKEGHSYDISKEA